MGLKAHAHSSKTLKRFSFPAVLQFRQQTHFPTLCSPLHLANCIVFGQAPVPNQPQTQYRFTGQRFDEPLAGGLYDYIAQRYDSGLGRFTQADTIVPNPGDPQSLNRYAYTNNNPLRYTDPSGHMLVEDNDANPCRSVSVHTPMLSVEFNVAGEHVYHVASHEETDFFVIGGDLSIGPDKDFINILFKKPATLLGMISFGVSPYYAVIRNVEDPVEDYSGPFAYHTTTIASKYGVTFGEATFPTESSLDVEDRKKANSSMGGLFFGGALTSNYGINYYIPVRTKSPQAFGYTYYSPLPYVRDILHGFSD